MALAYRRRLRHGDAHTGSEMVEPLFLLLAAVVPALLLMWYFHARDAYPEPPKVVWQTFGLGVLSIVPAVLAALALEGLVEAAFGPFVNPWVAGLSTAFLGAAIPEDLAKFCVLYYFCLRHTAFDEPMDGLVYGVAASMGFAALENVLYVWQDGFGLAVMRAFTAVPAHAMHGAIMGYFLGLYHFLPERRGFYLAMALALPIALHGAYDFPVLTIDYLPEDDPAIGFLFVATLAVLTVEIGLALVLAKRVRRAQHAGVHECAADPDFAVLEHYHRGPWHARDLVSYGLLMIGALLAWVGLVGVFVWGGEVAAALPTGGAIWLVLLALPAAGVVLFWKAISRLNRRRGGYTKGP